MDGSTMIPNEQDPPILDDHEKFVTTLISLSAKGDLPEPIYDSLKVSKTWKAFRDVLKDVDVFIDFLTDHKMLEFEKCIDILLYMIDMLLSHCTNEVNIGKYIYPYFYWEIYLACKEDPNRFSNFTSCSPPQDLKPLASSPLNKKRYLVGEDDKEIILDFGKFRFSLPANVDSLEYVINPNPVFNPDVIVKTKNPNSFFNGQLNLLRIQFKSEDWITKKEDAGIALQHFKQWADSITKREDPTDFKKFFKKDHKAILEKLLLLIMDIFPYRPDRLSLARFLEFFLKDHPYVFDVLSYHLNHIISKKNNLVYIDAQDLLAEPLNMLIKSWRIYLKEIGLSLPKRICHRCSATSSSDDHFPYEIDSDLKFYYSSENEDDSHENSPDYQKDFKKKMQMEYRMRILNWDYVAMRSLIPIEFEKHRKAYIEAKNNESDKRTNKMQKNKKLRVL